MVWLTIIIVPPPTNFFIFTRPRSGSMPVVSQSIIRPMVPVGASTLAWLLRTPYSSPSRTAAAQASAPACTSSAGTTEVLAISAWASRCMRSTLSMCTSLSAKPANGPIRLAVRALTA